MLARLDIELAPLRASVNRAGTLLRIEGPETPADAPSRVSTIVEQMGFLAQVDDKASESARWFGSGDVGRLSEEEARVLAERWVAELAAERIITDPQRLFEPLRATLLDAFREAAKTGSVDALRIDQEAIRGAVGDQGADAVLRWLGERLSIADHG